MSFEKIVGQESAIKILKSRIVHNKIGGSYLFLGPDGVGKRTTAIEFAKAVNCEIPVITGEDEVRYELCDCNSCRKIDSMNHPDVFMIYPEGPSYSIKISIIRDIIYQSSLKPYEGKKKFFIINDAEEMTEEAQNALLKLLEEPSRNHILILTASSIEGLLLTVSSRCRIVKFYSLGYRWIEEFLKSRGVREEEISLFSHMAMGSIGRAIGFKEKNLIARRDQVVNDFFLRKSVLLRENVLNEQITQDIEEGLSILLCWYRDILIAKITQSRLMLLNIDRGEEISSYANSFSRKRLERCLLAIMDTIGYLRRNINPKSAVFNMAVELYKAGRN